MSDECPACDRVVEPVSAPIVLNPDIDTDCIVSVNELRGLDSCDIDVENPVAAIVYYCPVCRYVFETARPDASWMWIDWGGIPVVVAGKEALPTLGID